MKEMEYNRNAAIEYAEKWAYKRNPNYYNFDLNGGDCTNFVSQCIFAGCKKMNYTKTYGWYYINGNNKSPSWTGVQYLYDFLINNKKEGPHAKEVSQTEIEIGDIAQLSFDGVKFSHTVIIVNIENKITLNGIRIASHTLDSFNKPISEYNFLKIRFLHIEKVMLW